MAISRRAESIRILSFRLPIQKLVCQSLGSLVILFFNGRAIFA